MMNFNSIKFEERKIENILFVFGFFLLLFLIMSVIYLNFSKLVCNVDTDYIAELDYGRKIAETHSIFPKGWFYANEFSFFRPASLYAIIYFFTGRYLFSHSLALSISLFFVLGTVVYFLKSLKISKLRILFSLILLFSLGGNGHRTLPVLIFLFYGYYSYYLCVIFFTLAFLESESTGIIQKIYSLLVILAAFLLGIVGIRMTVFLYLPLCLAGIANFVFFRKSTTCNKFCILLLFVNLFGLVLGKKVLGTPKGPVINIIDLHNLFSDLWNNICASFIMIFGTIGNFKIPSIRCIDIFFKFILVFSVIYCTFKYGKLILKSYISCIFFIISIFVIFSITTFTTFGKGVVFYYFLIPCFLIELFSLQDFLQPYDKMIVNRYVLFVVVIFLSISNFLCNYKSYIKKEDSNIKEVANYLIENNITNIISSFWVAGPIEAYSDGQVRFAYLAHGLPNDIAEFKWLNIKENYDNARYLILTDDEESKLLKNKNSKINNLNNRKIKEIGVYNIYEFEKNPFYVYEHTPFSIDNLEVGQMKLYDLSAFLLLNGTYLNENKEAVTMNRAGFVIAGPYADFVSGVYTVVFNYKTDIIDSTQEIGFADISDDKGQNVLMRKKLYADGKGSVVFENIDLTDKKNVEFRIFSNGENNLVISSVEITKIKE